VPEKNFGRTLVIRGGALGDFLLTLPVLRALRETSAHLEILGYPSFVQLAREGGLVHAGRSIEYGPMAGFFARGAVQDPALRDYFGSFDIVLSYLYDPDGIFAGNLQAAGARRIVQGPHKPAGQAHAIDELSAPLRELVRWPATQLFVSAAVPTCSVCFVWTLARVRLPWFAGSGAAKVAASRSSGLSPGRGYAQGSSSVRRPPSPTRPRLRRRQYP
jgi:hypothetical protein